MQLLLAPRRRQGRPLTAELHAAAGTPAKNTPRASLVLEEVPGPAAARSSNHPPAHLWQLAHQVCLLRPRLRLALLGASGRKVRLQHAAKAAAAVVAAGATAAEVLWCFSGLGTPLLQYSPPQHPQHPHLEPVYQALHLLALHQLLFQLLQRLAPAGTAGGRWRRQRRRRGWQLGGVAPAWVQDVTPVDPIAHASQGAPTAPATPSALTCRRECTRSGRFCPWLQRLMANADAEAKLDI